MLRPWLVLLLLACETPSPQDPDAAGPDAASPDAGADGGLDLGPDASPPDAAPPDGSPPDAAPPDDDRYRTTLASAAELVALAGGQGRDVKYLIPLPNRPIEPPLTAACYFQDTTRFPYHLDFLRSFPELASLDANTYGRLVLFAESRRWWGGAVQVWPGVAHPRTGVRGVISFDLYAEAGRGGLTVEAVAEVDQILSDCAPFARDLLVYVPRTPGQQQFARERRPLLTEAGVDLLYPHQLIADVESITYSPGEGYGYLRVVPPGQAPGPVERVDVVITQSAPNDLPVVAGLITADPQNVHSHVNLRLLEKGVPNAAVPGIYDDPLVAALDGQIVHVVAPETGSVTIAPATLEEAERFWESRRPDLPPLQADLSEVRVQAFADLTAAGASAYGAKAANLAELRNLLPPAHRQEGFGIPFARYADHLARNGITAEVEALLADARLADRTWRTEALRALRRRIREAPVDPALLADIDTQARTLLGEAANTTRLRFRSSTNVEDLPEITGAGLYDSYSGCPGDADETGPSACLSPEQAAFARSEIQRRQAELAAHPDRVWLVEIIEEFEEDLGEGRPVARALRRTWSSLWNDRAFEERAWYGLDHRQAYMGVAVHPSFSLEQVNAVVVTGLGDAGLGHRVVSQVGWLSVVRPEDPTAQAEVQTWERTADGLGAVQRVLPSSEVSEGTWLWEDLGPLAALVHQVHDHFATAVYPEHTRFDLEVKREAGGQIVIKQIRPFISAF